MRTKAQFTPANQEREFDKMNCPPILLRIMSQALRYVCVAVLCGTLAACDAGDKYAKGEVAARGLCECKEASCLEVAEVGADGKDHLLIPVAADAWRNLKAAALGDGVFLFIVSAFRSIDHQTEIVRRKLEAGMPIENILTVCAPPGFSEHHTGRAIDLSTPGCRALEVEFEQTAAFSWLRAYAANFGYCLSYPIGNASGYQYEPWHWCFRDA